MEDQNQYLLTGTRITDTQLPPGAAVGYQAGRVCNSGNDSVGIGHAVGLSTAGSNNVFIGYRGPNAGTVTPKYEIKIETLDRGYVVSVGCHKFAFSTKEEMLGKITEYYGDPAGTVKKWEEGVLFKEDEEIPYPPKKNTDNGTEQDSPFVFVGKEYIPPGIMYMKQESPFMGEKFPDGTVDEPNPPGENDAPKE